MKLKFFFIALLYLLSNFTPLIAETKIVYVDMAYLINKSSAGLNISSQLTKNHKKQTSELKTIEEELKKDEVEIIQQKNIISKEDFEKKISALRDKASKYQKLRKESNNKFNKKRNQATTQLIKIIQKIIAEYAENNDISIIVQKKNIVIGKSNLDITPIILKTLNNDFKTLKIK